MLRMQQKQVWSLFDLNVRFSVRQKPKTLSIRRYPWHGSRASQLGRLWVNTDSSGLITLASNPLFSFHAPSPLSPLSFTLTTSKSFPTTTQNVQKRIVGLEMHKLASNFSFIVETVSWFEIEPMLLTFLSENPVQNPHVSLGELFPKFLGNRRSTTPNRKLASAQSLLLSLPLLPSGSTANQNFPHRQNFQTKFNSSRRNKFQGGEIANRVTLQNRHFFTISRNLRRSSRANWCTRAKSGRLQSWISRHTSLRAKARV